jgi:hypothetical protein
VENSQQVSDQLVGEELQLKGSTVLMCVESRLLLLINDLIGQRGPPNSDGIPVTEPIGDTSMESFSVQKSTVERIEIDNTIAILLRTNFCMSPVNFLVNYHQTIRVRVSTT